MDINKYLEVSGKRDKDLAKEIGVSPVSICNYKKRRRMPCSWVIAKMEVVTKGMVTLHDWIAYWEAKK